MNLATINLVKHFESLHDGDLGMIGLQPKMCPVGIWTYGYGHAMRGSNGEFLRGNKDKAEAYRMYRYLEAEGACVLLDRDLEEYSKKVSGLLYHTPNENQLGAMTSLAFNIGVNGFATSSVLRHYNKRDLLASADSFKLWNKATIDGVKVVMPGLVKRRTAEKVLFLET